MRTPEGRAMGDDYRTERVLGIPRTSEFPQHELPQRRGYSAYASAAEQPPKSEHSFHDVASVLGIPAEGLTAEILAVAVPLLSELDRLRWQAEQSNRRQAHLSRLADRHSVVPCLNRRAFMRELEAFLQGGESEGTLAVLHLGGVELLRRVHGLAAGEGMMRHGAATILGAIRTSDMAGCLGGSDFALLLTVADEHDSRGKLAEICQRINDPAFTWLGQPITVATILGIHVLGPGEGAEQALAAADRNRRGLG